MSVNTGDVWVKSVFVCLTPLWLWAEPNKHPSNRIHVLREVKLCVSEVSSVTYTLAPLLQLRWLSPFSTCLPLQLCMLISRLHRRYFFSSFPQRENMPWSAWKNELKWQKKGDQKRFSQLVPPGLQSYTVAACGRVLGNYIGMAVCNRQ